MAARTETPPSEGLGDAGSTGPTTVVKESSEPANSDTGSSPKPAVLNGWFAELKRRRVFRALVGYGIAAFAVLQVIEPIMHGAHWPEIVLSYVVAALAAGFPIVITLAWAFDVKAGRIERTAPAPASTGLRGVRLALLLVGIGLLAAAPGLVYYFFLRSARPAAAPESGAGPSIAVLPLVNLSSDKEQEYFSDGLTEELLNLLAKVPGLRVAARTSTFAFKGKNEDVGVIAQKLHVAAILEGSVRKAGDQIRITTQLINVADGYHLWSESYDRKLTDVFAVQDEIAQAVVAALKLKLLQAPTSKNSHTANPEAYNQYLLGRQFFYFGNEDSYRRSVQAYERALALDPGYAPAWAGLATTTYWLANISAESATAMAESYERALAAAEKAVALGPDIAEGYRTRGTLRTLTKWDWVGARADLERALALSPENADTLTTYALLLLAPFGRLPEAVATFRKATELDPLNPRAWTWLGGALLQSGQLGPAREALNRSLEISPHQSTINRYYLVMAFLLDGQPAAALASSQRSTISFRLAGDALAQHDLGHPGESQQALDKLIVRFGHIAAYQVAQVYAWRGENDRGFEWLQRAYAQRDSALRNLKVDPFLRKLRDDPRYTALLKKMNLPAD